MKKRLRSILSRSLSPEDLLRVYSSYDIVGDIAIMPITEESLKLGPSVAEAIMKVHRNVKTVLAQSGPVAGDLRLRQLVFVAGEKKTATLHKEYGCVFSVDVEKVFFSPRLSYERMRIAKLIRGPEIVLNMFAGVGCFSIVIARYSAAEKVYSVDVNPVAVRLMRRNVRMNRVYGRVMPLLGDAAQTVSGGLNRLADRVLMPLPQKASEYLPDAVHALKEQGGWVHFYGFEHSGRGEDPVEKVKQHVSNRLRDLGIRFNLNFGRIVRTTGPNWYQVVLDIKIETSVRRGNHEFGKFGPNFYFSSRRVAPPLRLIRP